MKVSKIGEADRYVMDVVGDWRSSGLTPSFKDRRIFTMKREAKVHADYWTAHSLEAMIIMERPDEQEEDVNHGATEFQGDAQ